MAERTPQTARAPRNRQQQTQRRPENRPAHTEQHICPMCGQPCGDLLTNRRDQLRDKWGRNFADDEGNLKDYTDSEIEELERIYKMLSAEYKGAMTPRMEYALRKIVKLELEQQKAMAKGDSQEAKRYADIIKDVKKAEGMNVGDTRPLDSVKIDSIIDALEKKGMVKEGKIVGRAELVKILAGASQSYNTSLDVVDEMMFAILNTMRRNNGESELNELPVSAQVKDRKGELRERMSDRERRDSNALGVIPPTRARPQEVR